MDAPAYFVEYANVLVFLLVGIAFVFLNVSIVARILRPRIQEQGKDTTYECGEPAFGTSWVRFDMRFYVVALVFIIFDVEIAFLYPWALVFRDLKFENAARTAIDPFVAWEAVVFLAILLVGFVYVWARGDLDWVKDTSAEGAETPGEYAEQVRKATGQIDAQRESEGVRS